MSNVRFISDLHFGHLGVAKYRGFEYWHDHDEHLIRQWNKVVHKKDKVFIMGDITMENSKYYYLLDRLKGLKVVILGNHDRPHDVPELLKYVHQVSGMLSYKGNWLTHCPIHESEFYRCRFNIHGHSHGNPKVSDRHINVCAELIDYQPKTLEELINGQKGSVG